MRSFLKLSLVRPLLVASLAAATTTMACADRGPQDTLPDEQDVTSNVGIPLEFSFHGEVVGRKSEAARMTVSKQLAYLNGILVSDVEGNAQPGMPKLDNVVETEDEGGLTKHISYDAKVTVIWPKGEDVPESYDLVLPLDTTKLSAFNKKYDGTCGKNEYGQATFWHDFNPKAPTCEPDDADVSRSDVTVERHPDTTENVYPEYDKVWEDGELNLVAVMGIISSNTPNDEGARERETLLRDATNAIDDAERTEHELSGKILADSTVSGTVMRNGKKQKVNVTALLVHTVSTAGTEFNTRLEEATKNADVVIYSGHSGLGKNINGIGDHVDTEKDHYQFLYLYGCQTLGYLGPQMHDKRIALNGADVDPEGTKFLDVLFTALPAYGDDGRSNRAIFNAFLHPEEKPQTFNDIMKSVSSLHLSLVYGEHDNTYKP